MADVLGTGMLGSATALELGSRASAVHVVVLHLDALIFLHDGDHERLAGNALARA